MMPTSQHLPSQMTLEEVAREIGVTPERVRQIEARALRKIRLALRRNGYTVEDFHVDAGRHPLDIR